MDKAINFVFSERSISELILFAICVGVIIFNKQIITIIMKITSKLAKYVSDDYKARVSSSLLNPLRLLLISSSIFTFLFSINNTYDIFNKGLLIRIFSTIIILILLKIALNLFDINSVIIEKIEEKFNYSFDKALIALLSRVIKAIALIAAITAIIKTWGYNVNFIVTIVGIFSAAVGLAGKDYLTNVFGGLTIVTDKPFSIGDYIETASVSGIVEDINFRSTKVRTFDKAMLTIPNSTLVDDAVSNYSRRDSRRARFTVGITYDTPIDKIEKVVNLIRNMLLENEDVENDGLICYFDTFGESSLDIFMNFYINRGDWAEFMEVKQNINLEIMRILEREDVEIAFPSRTLYVNKID